MKWELCLLRFNGNKDRKHVNINYRIKTSSTMNSVTIDSLYH